MIKTPSLSDLQKELLTQTPKRIVEITTRLAKHKKENKELLAYLLFESEDQSAFIHKTTEEIDLQFSDMNKSNLYLAKKTLRKILRLVNKQIKFSGQPETELELRIYYLRKVRESGIAYTKSQVLMNLYTNQVKKIELTLEKLHEDLQFDYASEVEKLRNGVMQYKC